MATPRVASPPATTPHAGNYFILAFFDSYDSAMKNSALPQTAAFAEKYATFVDAPMVFHDLDVIDDFS
jgi:hypothetical protein